MSGTAQVQVPMSVQEVEQILATVRGASRPGKVEDGSRVHVHYEAFGKASAEAIVHAKRADELGLPKDRYTGRVSRVWRSKSNDLLVNLFVELERDHMYRTLNASRGKMMKFVVLGN